MEPKLCKPVERGGVYVCSVCGFNNGDTRTFTRLCGTREERLEQLKQLNHIRGQPPLDEGPGTELKKILSRFGIKERRGCGCGARATEMNQKGADWCRKNVDEILGWMETEARRQKLLFVRGVAKVMVLMAIRRAEKKQRKTAE